MKAPTRKVRPRTASERAAEKRAHEQQTGPKEPYRVTERGSVRYNGKTVGPGGTVELDAQTAVHLQARGSVVPISPQRPPAKSRPNAQDSQSK